MKFASIGLPDESQRGPSIDAATLESSSLGFTLIETLTALTILAIALVSLFDAHRAGMRTTGVAENSGKARIIAEALLADVKSGWNPDRRSQNGRSGLFDWSVEISPVRGDYGATDTETNWRLHMIRVSVSWDHGRHIDLETLKLYKIKTQIQ